MENLSNASVFKQGLGRRRAWLLFWIFLAFMSWGSQAAAQDAAEKAAAMVVDAGAPVTALNPLLFGQNLLFSGNGLWNARINDLDPAGVALVKNLAPTSIRFPGGSVSDQYFWEDGLGYRTTAAVSPGVTSIPLDGAPAWDNVLEARIMAPGSRSWGDPIKFLRVEGNRLEGVIGLKGSYPAGAWVRLERRSGQPDWFSHTYGILEFLKSVKSLDAQAIITVNYGTGLDRKGRPSTGASLSQRVKRAAALVALVNGNPGDSRSLGKDEEGHDWRTVGFWAGQRAALGHPQPFKVLYWEVGNEVSDKSETGFTDAARYAGDFVSFAKGMKEVDPAIKLGAVGLNYPRGKGDADPVREWNPTVLKTAGNCLDFFILHPYYPAAGKDTTLYKTLPWFAAVMAGTHQAMANLREIRSLINASVPPGRQVGLAITEYGIWPVASKDGQDYSNLAAALYNADLLMHLIREGADLGIILAAAWNLHGSNPTAAISYNWSTGARVLRPQYYALELLVKNVGPQILQTQVKAPVFATSLMGNVKPRADIPLLGALASLSQDRSRLTLLVINRSLNSPLRTSIRFQGFTPRPRATVHTLAGKSAGDHNEKNPQTVAPMAGALDYAAPEFPFTFKPHSFTVLTFQAQP
ncbi:MAG: alpha-L-arabinofuranosidase C-terminal domain-containing protein [Thermodesulfobacteriota bacterium]